MDFKRWLTVIDLRNYDNLGLSALITFLIIYCQAVWIRIVHRKACAKCNLISSRWTLRCYRGWKGTFLLDWRSGEETQQAVAIQWVLLGSGPAFEIGWSQDATSLLGLTVKPVLNNSHVDKVLELELARFRRGTTPQWKTDKSFTRWPNPKRFALFPKNKLTNNIAICSYLTSWMWGNDSCECHGAPLPKGDLVKWCLWDLNDKKNQQSLNERWQAAILQRQN